MALEPSGFFIDFINTSVPFPINRIASWQASSSPFPYSASGYLFVQEDGCPIDPSHPSNLFTKVSKKAGLPPQRLHDLRHFHATELIRSGANILGVSDRLGDSPIEITLGVYGHIRPEDRSEIAEKFAKVLNLH